MNIRQRHRISSLVQIVQSSSGGPPPPGLVSAEPLADLGFRCFPDPEWASEKSTLCCGSGTMPGSENTALRAVNPSVKQVLT